VTRHLLLYMKFFFFCEGGGGEIVTGLKIVASIVGKSRGTLNTITRQIPKFFEIYTQCSVNGL